MFFSFLAVFSIAGKLPKWPKIPFQYPLALRHPKILEKCRKHHRILVSVRNRFWAPPAKADIATAILTNVIEHLVLLFCPPISTPSPPKRCGRIPSKSLRSCVGELGGFARIYTCIYIYMYMYLYVSIFICMYICKYIYIYRHLLYIDSSSFQTYWFSSRKPGSWSVWVRFFQGPQGPNWAPLRLEWDFTTFTEDRMVGLVGLFFFWHDKYRMGPPSDVNIGL